MTAEPAAVIVPAAIFRPGTPGARPDEMSESTRQAILDGIPAETSRAYARDWADFTQWCADNGRTPMPASGAVLADYANWLCYSRPVRDRNGDVIPGKAGMSPSSVKRYLSSVRVAHRAAQAPLPPADDANRVIKGYEKHLSETRDPRARPRKAEALDRDMLAAMTGPGLKGEQALIRARDKAMFYLAYAAATRVSELVSINIEDVTQVSQGLVVALYRGKRRLHHDVKIPRAHAPETVAAVLYWISELAKNGRTAGPLFPNIGARGEIGAAAAEARSGTGDGRMRARSAEYRFDLAAKAAGLEGKITVHSARRGLPTAARLAGHDQLAIGRHGGWADGSAALAGYIQEADEWALNPLEGAGI